MMLAFTKLEQVVLAAICDRQRDAIPSLPSLLASGSVLSRENTGHGFFTQFRAEAGKTQSLGPQPISGPDVRMIGMGEDAMMGFLLWCSTDEPSQLEGFQYADANGDQVDLKAMNLADLCFTEIVWP